MAESKELLGGLYVQDQYEINGDPETVKYQFTYHSRIIYPCDKCM